MKRRSGEKRTRGHEQRPYTFPFFCIEIKMINILGGYIVPGDFIFARKRNDMAGVCQVQIITSPQNIRVVWWVESDVAPPLCPDVYPNLLRSNFTELFAEDASFITFEDVIDLAFIFRAEVLENVWTDLAGMSRVFFFQDLPTIHHSAPIWWKAFPAESGTLYLALKI